MPDSFDAFISYKREDQAFAEILRERLIAWGYTAWMDKYNIPAGADWPIEIEKGLRACHTVIAVMTPQAIESENVQNEWEWAIVYHKRLIPLHLQPCKPPLNLIRKNYIDFVPDQEAGFARLKTALESEEIPVTRDPYHEYLQALYDRINAVLAQTIIKINPDKPGERKPIPLVSERTHGTVDALFEQQDRVDPMLAAFGLPSQEWKSGDFRTAFEHFDGRVLLLGEPGAGKSITLLHFGRDAIVRRMQDPALPLPIWGLIPTWDAEKQTPLAEWLANTYGAPPDIARIVAEGQALLLLDGLDELGSERENPETKERYDPRRRFMGVIPANNQVVVTCRVKDYEEIGEKIALKGAVTLQPLTDAQIHDYLSAEVPDLWAALETDEKLRDVARTPLLLSLFAFGYKGQGEKTAKLRDLRERPGELRDTIFGQYVKQRYEHEVNKLRLRQPPERLPFTLDEIYKVLGRAAMTICAREWGKEDVLDPHVFGLSGERLSAFTELAVRLHILMPSEGNTFRFIHLLLRDHFGFPYALTYLNNVDTLTHREAIAALGRIGDARAVELLIAALDDTSEIVRFSAIDALGQIGDTRAVEPLITALHNGESNAPIALSRIRDTRAVEPLIAGLYNPDEIIRLFSVMGLGQIEDTRAVEPLIAALHDTDETVHFFATNALQQIGEPAVRPLVAALHDDDEVIRNRVAYVLSVIGESAIEPLVAALHDTNETVLIFAAHTLGQIGEPAVKPLVAALHDDNEITRGSAAYALSRIGGPAIEPLVVALHDTDETVRFFAANALGQIGEPAVEPLIAVLNDDEVASRTAAHALSLIGEPAVELLMAVLRNGEEVTRGRAAYALSLIGEPAIKPLIAALHNTGERVHIFAAYALILIGEPAIESLIATLRDEDGDVRFFAASALRQIGGPATEPLVAALRNGEEIVRRGAVYALGQIEDDRTVEPLVAALSDKDENVRLLSAMGLGQRGDPRAVKPLIAILCSGDDDAQSLAAEALEKIDTQKALAAVEKWRQEQNQE